MSVTEHSSLRAPVRHEQAPARRDPAPSRISYRMQRLWLTPLFHTMLRKGLPAFVVVLGVGLYLSAPDRRAGLVDWAESLRQQVAERPEFQVRMMAVDGASPALADAIRELVPVDFPISSFELDLDAIQKTVLGLDAVAAVDVRVKSGGILSLEVSERQPVVVWRSSTGIGTLDRTGHPVTALKGRLERPDLPLIAGEGAEKAVPEALAVLAAAGPIATRVRGLVRVGERRWDVMLEGDIRLMLPQNAPVAAIEQIVALDESQHLLERDITTVDLRIPSRVTVRLSPEAVGEFHQVNVLATGARR